MQNISKRLNRIATILIAVAMGLFVVDFVRTIPLFIIPIIGWIVAIIMLPSYAFTVAVGIIALVKSIKNKPSVVVGILTCGIAVIFAGYIGTIALVAGVLTIISAVVKKSAVEETLD